MTVLTETYKIDHIGNGSQVDFNYDFRIMRSDEVLVTLDRVATTDYTITGIDDPNGGVVTFNTAPDVGVEVTIARDVPYTQLVDYRPMDPFPAETHEAALDRIVMMIQQIGGFFSRGMVADPEMPDDVDLTVPVPGAGEFFKYTDDGKGIETSDINELGTQIIPTMTDAEIVSGTGTQTRLISASQVKLGVETHETAPLNSVYDVGWVEVVDTLPATPNPNTMYLVRN